MSAPFMINEAGNLGHSNAYVIHSFFCSDSVPVTPLPALADGLREAMTMP